MTIRGTWATPAAREKFSETELADCVRDYNERGPQWWREGAGFAFYDFPGEPRRSLALAEHRGLATLMTKEELLEARRNL